MTRYIHHLHAVCLAAKAAEVSARIFAMLPDVGPDNFVPQFGPINGPDDAEATHAVFSSPITEAHRTMLIANGWREDADIEEWTLTDRAFTVVVSSMPGVDTGDVQNTEQFVSGNGLKARREVVLI
jgi:hypothetical protein